MSNFWNLYVPIVLCAMLVLENVYEMKYKWDKNSLILSHANTHANTHKSTLSLAVFVHHILKIFDNTSQALIIQIMFHQQVVFIGSINLCVDVCVLYYKTYIHTFLLQRLISIYMYFVIHFFLNEEIVRILMIKILYKIYNT